MFILLFILAYLMGSIPTALIVGKVFFGIDIRKHGSQNPGATNSLRVLGKRAAIVVLLVDVGKGAFAASLPFMFQIEVSPLYPGLAAVIGHCFPIFAGFRGGKAIATTAGTLLIANFPLCLIAYLSFFAVIFLTKYVFFGSLSVGLILFLYTIMKQGPEDDLLFLLFLLLLIFLHRTNIRNFLYHKEPKITDKNLINDRIKPV